MAKIQSCVLALLMEMFTGKLNGKLYSNHYHHLSHMFCVVINDSYLDQFKISYLMLFIRVLINKLYVMINNILVIKIFLIVFLFFFIFTCLIINIFFKRKILFL